MGFFDERMKASYADRAAASANPAGKKLFQLMHEKKTNVACAVDVVKSRELLDLVGKFGEELAVVKTFSILRMQDIFSIVKDRIKPEIREAWVDYYEKYGAIRLG